MTQTARGRERPAARGWWVAAAALVLGLASAPARAAGDGEVAVGGYLDLTPAAGGDAAALFADEAPPLTPTLGRLAVSESSRGAPALTYFTPRLSGFELGFGYAPDALGARDGAEPPGHVPGGDGPLAVGGGLRQLSALELGLIPHASDDAAEDDAAGLVTAGVGYGFGPVSTNLTYGFAKPAIDEELNLFALSADLALVPGVAVSGGLAYAEEEKTGDQTAAGVLGLRLNF